jgi:long-chain acyl-CoA synthetase
VLDPDAARMWATQHGQADASLADLARDADLVAELQKAVDEANAEVSQAEQVRKFKVLPAEWSVESGELTPTLKLKRRVVNERYGGEIEELYRA